MPPKDKSFAFQTYIFEINGALNLNINQEEESDSFSHSLFIFILNKNSHLKIHHFVDSKISYLMNSFFAFLGSDSCMEFFSAYFANPFTKNDKYIYIEREGARCIVRDIFITDDKMSLNLRNELIFKKGYTNGEEYSRGVLKGESSVSLYGLARVEKNLKKINAFVEGDAILLSKRAKFLPVPSLEILSNDLRCTHAVNSGPIPEEKLFYLISRGIKREDAIKMYIESYILSNTEGADEEFKEKVKNYLYSIKI